MRNVRLVPTLGLALAAAVASCSRPPARDIAFYRAHPTERATRLEACRGDRGRLSPIADCISALAADSADTSRKFWTTPPPASRVQHPNTL